MKIRAISIFYIFAFLTFSRALCAKTQEQKDNQPTQELPTSPSSAAAAATTATQTPPAEIQTTNTPPTDPSANPNPELPPPSGGKLATSILVGSTLGFGLGHAIQGRYQDRGWLTIAQISSLYVMGAGFLECDGGFSYLFGRQNGVTPVNQNGCGLIRAGSLVFIGLRIFEFVDLLSLIPTSKRTASTFHLLPHPNALSLTLNF